eukprot:770197-Rhodomonas_salina.4
MTEPMNDPSIVEVVVNAPALDVWQRVADVRTWNTWRAKDSKVSTKSSNKHLLVGDVFKWTAGGPIKSTITQSEAGRVLTWKGDMLSLIQAHHRWRFEVVDEKTTKVVVEEEMSGCLGWMMGKKQLDQLNTEWLNELRDSFEK